VEKVNKWWCANTSRVVCIANTWQTLKQPWTVCSNHKMRSKMPKSLQARWNRVHDLSVYHSLAVSSLEYSFNDMNSGRIWGLMGVPHKQQCLHPQRWDWHLRMKYICQFQKEQEQRLSLILSISIPLPAGLHKWPLSAKIEPVIWL